MPLAFYARGNNHGYPTRYSSAFHKTTAASPQASDNSTLVGNVSLSRFIEALGASLKRIDTTVSGAIEILRCNNIVIRETHIRNGDAPAF
jgi:hypothetical protein